MIARNLELQTNLSKTLKLLLQKTRNNHNIPSSSRAPSRESERFLVLTLKIHSYKTSLNNKMYYNMLKRKLLFSLTNCNPQILIEVTGYKLFDSNISKYAMYSVIGKDKNGDFEVLRRYSEFDQIRKLMIKRWPGCYIPPLPSKKAIVCRPAIFIKSQHTSLNTTFLSSIFMYFFDVFC